MKIYNLPEKTIQIASKHNIVLKQERSDRTVFLKCSPRSHIREQLYQVCRPDITSYLDGVNSVAVRPSSFEQIHDLTFFVFPGVEPPLSKARILSCFPDFLVKSAQALQILHIKDKLAHLDIRTFNLGYLLCKGEEEAKVVFIDLDTSTSALESSAGNSKSKIEQRRKPDAWPETVSYSVARCDWRQWAMMIWSLLELSQEENIYEGKVRNCPYEFLEDVLTGKRIDWDALSSAELVCELNRWLQSNDLQQTRHVIGSSTLAAQVCSHG